MLRWPFTLTEAMSHFYATNVDNVGLGSALNALPQGRWRPRIRDLLAGELYNRTEQYVQQLRLRYTGGRR